MPFYLYYGPEKVRLNRIKDKICKSCQYPEFDLLQTDTFSSEVEEFAENSSMLNGNRVVVIKSLELKTDEMLLSYIKKGSHAQVYIVAEHVDIRSRLFNELKACSKELPKYTDSELFKILRPSAGTNLSDECLYYLISESGYISDDDVSMDTINIYLSQLALLERAIGKADIDNIIHREKRGQIWHLFGYLAKKDLNGFLREYNLVGGDDIGILSLMLRNARLGYKACICRQMKMSEKEIAEKINVNTSAISFSKALSSDSAFQMMDILQSSVNAIKDGKDAKLVTITAASKLANLFY